MSHFVHDNGFVNLEAIAAAPTQVHVVFVGWLDQSELLKPKLEVEVKAPVHIAWYIGSPRPEADVYTLASPEDLIAALGKYSQVMRVSVGRSNGQRV